MESVDSARVSGLLGWLEEEQHQTKAQLGRLQYQIEQLANLTREQAGQIRAAQEELGSARNQLGRLAALDELARQLRESLARLQSAYAEHLQESDKEDKGQQADIERTKQSVTDIMLRIDFVYKEFEPLLSRTQGLGDTGRRHQESIVELSKKVDTVGTQTEAMGTRLQIAAEQGRRNDGEIERINRRIDTLQGQDEVAVARIQILTDKLKNVSDQMASVLADEQTKVDLSERIQVLRLEQQRLAKQLNDIIPLVDVHGARLDEQVREIRQVEERRQLTADELKDLRGILTDQVTRLEGYVIAVEEMEERHRRRQMAELELQANELRTRVVKLKGQGL